MKSSKTAVWNSKSNLLDTITKTKLNKSQIKTFKFYKNLFVFFCIKNLFDIINEIIAV